MANGSDPASGTAGPGSVGQVSVWQRLIELEFRNGFRIGGVESAGLIELKDALRRRPSGRQWRGLGREIEIGENGANSRSSPARSRAGMWTEASMLNPPEACHVSMSSVTCRSSQPWRWK